MKLGMLLVSMGALAMVADAGNGGAAVVDAFAQSGPSLAGLGALALTLYKWLGDIKTELVSVKEELKKREAADQSLHSAIVELKAENKDVVRRLERVERAGHERGLSRTTRRDEGEG